MPQIQTMSPEKSFSSTQRFSRIISRQVHVVVSSLLQDVLQSFGVCDIQTVFTESSPDASDGSELVFPFGFCNTTFRDEEFVGVSCKAVLGEWKKKKTEV